MARPKRLLPSEWQAEMEESWDKGMQQYNGEFDVEPWAGNDSKLIKNAWEILPKVWQKMSDKTPAPLPTVDHHGRS